MQAFIALNQAPFDGLLGSSSQVNFDFQKDARAQRAEQVRARSAPLHISLIIMKVARWFSCATEQQLAVCVEYVIDMLHCRTAFIPFLMAGDPDMATTSKAIQTLDKLGADVIELGVPYSVSTAHAKYC